MTDGLSEAYEAKQWDVFCENNDLLLENGELKAENAKLRELVVLMYRAMHPADREKLVVNVAELVSDMAVGP